MDQLYFEEGYIDAYYLTRIREVSVDLSPYFVDDYLPDDYYTYSGSAFTLTAELTPAGVDVFATGSWSSEFTQTVAITRTRSSSSSMSTEFAQTANVNVIRGANVSMSAEFTQTATISHIEGADLFALSDAALTAQVSRLRDSNIAVSAVFNAAIDISRLVQVNADESAAFSFTAQVIRSRDSASSLEAAFSLAASNDKVITTSVNLSTTATLDCSFKVKKEYASAYESASFTEVVDFTRIRGFDSSLSSAFNISITATATKEIVSSIATETTLTSTGDRLRSTSITASSAFNLSATISHIHGADLTAFANASLSASPTITASANSSLASQTALSGSLTGTINGAAAFSATATLSANPRVNIRTTTITEVGGAGYVTATIDTSIKKWGSGSLKWTSPSAEPYPTSNIVWTGSQFKAFSNGYTWTSSNGTDWTRATNNLTDYDNTSDITYANGNFVAITVSSIYKFKYSSNGTTWSDTTLTGSVWGNSFIRKLEVYYVSGYYYIFDTRTIGSIFTLVSFRSTSLTGSWARFDLSNTTHPDRAIADITLVGSTPYIMCASGTAFFGVRFTGGSGPWGGWLQTGLSSRSAQTGSWDGANDYLTWTSSGSGNGYIYWKNATTIGNYVFNHLTTNIQYANGIWFISTSDGVYKTTAVDIEPTLIDLESPDYSEGVQYRASKYIARSTINGYVKTSTDASTWTYADIDPQVLPGSLTYSRGDNSDVGTFKTLDFWYYNTDGQAGRRFVFEQSSTRYISFGIGSNDTVEFQNVNGGSSSNLSATETALLPFNTWTHIRLSIDGSNASLYVGGTRKATTGSWLGGVIAPLKIGGATLPNPKQYAAQFDEIFITDQLITAPSTTSFSTPTQAWNNSSTDVDLLLHFNGDFLDDTAFFVDPSASLSATATLTANLTGTKPFASAMASQFALTAVIGKLNEIVLTAFADAALTTNISKFTGYESNQSAAFAISIDNARTRDVLSSQSSEFSQSLTFDRFRSTSSTLASEFAQSTTAVKTTDVTANTSSNVTQLTDSVKTAEAVLSISSAFTPVIVALATKNGEIILQTSATLTADNARTRGMSADVAATATLTTSISKILSAGATLSSEFAVIATSTGTIDAEADLASEFTQTTEIRRNRFGAAEFSSVFQQYTNTQDSLARQASAALSVSTALSADNLRVRFATINTDAIFSELVATAISASANISMSATATMAITAQRTRGVAANANCQTALSVPGERKLASAVISASSSTSLTAEGTTNITAEADLSVVVSLTAFATRSRDIDILANNFASLTASIARTRTTTSAMSATATMTVSTTKLVGSSATLVSTATFSATGTRRIGVIANLVANGGLLVVGRIIKVDTYVYKIPAETRIHKISSETRKYAIRSETRKHIIRRA